MIFTPYRYSFDKKTEEITLEEADKFSRLLIHDRVSPDEWSDEDYETLVKLEKFLRLGGFNETSDFITLELNCFERMEDLDRAGIEEDRR